MRKLNIDKLKDREHIIMSTEDAITEFEESLKQMQDMREGKLPKKTWEEFRKELDKTEAEDEIKFDEFLIKHKKEIKEIIDKNAGLIPLTKNEFEEDWGCDK